MTYLVEFNLTNILDQNVNGAGGDLLFTRGTVGQDDFRAFVFDDVERLGFAHGGIYDASDGLVNATYQGWAADITGVLQANVLGGVQGFSQAGTINQLNLPVIDDPELGDVNGLQDIATAFSWSVDSGEKNATITSFIQIHPRHLQSLSGDWRGLEIDEFAHDRNVDIATERESSSIENTGVNGVPNTAQFLGELAPFERGGDDNRRLGFDVHGLIAHPGDVDVYSFNAIAGREVWLDLDNTSPGLDSVIELIDANGTVLARSDDSYSEGIGATDTFANRQFAGTFCL